jgi:2-phosphoglycerate kinase
MINVNKRSGSTEEFSFDKLVNSIAKTGLDIKDSEKVALKVQGWVTKNKVNNSVKSADLREQVIKNLESQFPIEKENYEDYSKI